MGVSILRIGLDQILQTELFLLPHNSQPYIAQLVVAIIAQLVVAMHGMIWTNKNMQAYKPFIIH